MILVDIFSDIVASMRATGTITNKSVASGITTVTSVNTLIVGEVINMDDVNYVVLTASSTLFTVKGTGITASSWTALAPYYDYGHPQEISDKLADKDGHQTKKYQKYPLIAFYTDVRIKHGDAKVYGKLERQFMSIIGQSDKSYSSVQRYANVIIPVLIPLHKALVKKIQSSKYFRGTNPKLDHEEVRRPFWGSTSKYGNVANLFNDPLDGIDMENISMKLTNRNINC